MSADAPIRILALDGIPEIRDGDDLGVFIGNAIQRTRGALPLGVDDVLVVTQKIVSKAEGAVVDLTDGRAPPRGRSNSPSGTTAIRARSRSSCARRGASSG